MTVRRALLIVVALSAGGGGGSLAAQQARHVPRAHFDHYTHRRLFPTCTSCHQAPAVGEGPLYPDSSACASCHNGAVQPRVAWRPPEGPRRTNLRFDHALVPLMTPAGQPEPPGCTVCHGKEGGPWMAVERVNFGRCLSCHGVRTAHLAAPDSACAVCHLPLVRAKELTRADVALFPAPPSHQERGWVGGRGHGRAAQSAGTGGGVGSCAICHAREFCLTCHIGGPERVAIQALESDPRSTAIVAHVAPPSSHGDPTFLTRHGPMAAREPATCAGCHVRADCLACHRPAAGAGAGYHPTGFLARHPAAAYARETSCSECHNAAGFCTACHATSGLVSGGGGGPLRPGYHDANNFFAVGHGKAARQSLESCTACHAERDCLTCHSALGGRRFDPHGPGFDAERLRRKNPQMCTVCHDTAIPPVP